MNTHDDDDENDDNNDDDDDDDDDNNCNDNDDDDDQVLPADWARHDSREGAPCRTHFCQQVSSSSSS